MKKNIPQTGVYYVYELCYPSGEVFYVGKGKGNRINQHETEARTGRKSYKCNVIRQIWSDGEQIIKRKVQEGMSEEAAYALEIDLIRLYGREHLTNLTDGGAGGTYVNRGDEGYSIDPSSGYQRFIKPRREAERAAYIAEHGEAPKRGPKPRKQRETLVLHIKLSGNLRAIVERKCKTQDYQAYIARLIEQDEFSDVCENS